MPLPLTRFVEQIKAAVKTHFNMNYSKLRGGDESKELLYCDFFTPGYDPSIYEEVTPDPYPNRHPNPNPEPYPDPNPSPSPQPQL